MRETFDFLIVGAGMSGLVVAERLGSAGYKCLIVEKRSHLGGNCYDTRDKNGLLYHVYGPHYFRTNSTQVVEYLSRFTSWLKAEYRVKVYAQGTYFSFPINLATFRQLQGNHSATEGDFLQYLAVHRKPNLIAENCEDAMQAAVGPELFEFFYRNYTEKQWGRPASQLEPSVCRRIPVRTWFDERYFDEEFQALPSHGYTRMLENMAAASGAKVILETDYREVVRHVSFNQMVYTGPIDEYFNHDCGELPYRSLRFELKTIQLDDSASPYVQPALQVNYAGKEPYTRTVELKHITGQNSGFTNIVREFPETFIRSRNEPYYPVPSGASAELASIYRKKAEANDKVAFLGRLATYRYLNMDQVVAGALHFAKTTRI